MSRHCAVPPILALVAIGGLALNAGAGARFGPGATIEVPDSDFKLQLTGYAQGDLRAFPGWPEEGDEASPLHSETADLRRLRLGFECRWRALALDFSADPQDTGNHLKNVYLDLRLAKALRVRGGHFKLPVSREQLTSAARLDFAERALLAQNLAPDRDWGVMVHGEPFKKAEYMLGVFAGDGSQSDVRAKTTLAGRVVYSLSKKLDVAASASWGKVDSPVLADAGLNTSKGFKGEGPSGYTFFTRPFVNGRRSRLNLDAALISGSAALKAEVLYGREQRLGQGGTCVPAGGNALLCEDLSDFAGLGWSVTGSWLVTGDKKKTAISPARPLPRGAGAFELALRIEGLRLDDTSPAGGYESVASRARDLRPAANLTATAGASWWPTYWTRLMADFIVERLSDDLRVPKPDQRSSMTLLVRFQVAVP